MKTQLANYQFRYVDLPHWHRVAQEVFRDEMASILVSDVFVGLLEVHLFLCASSVFADSLLCHFGKEGSHPCGFHERLLGVILSEPPPVYAKETQLPTSSLLGFQHGILDQVLRFHQSSTRKPSFGYVGHIQGKVHVGLFWLYPTSLLCHSSWHVGNLQEISCCF